MKACIFIRLLKTVINNHNKEDRPDKVIKFQAAQKRRHGIEVRKSAQAVGKTEAMIRL